jgi:hypothetical protein
MRRVRAVVERSNGSLHFIPISELWDVSGILADALPLDRDPRFPRPLRRAGHWSRLTLIDRAVTNREGTAVLTIRDTPWVAAVGAAVAAAVVAPRLPAWTRRTLFVLGVIWAVRGNRVRHYVELRRELRRVAPDAVIVSDFVGRRPGAGMSWAADVLDILGEQTPFVALLPGAADARRNRARERLYTKRLGFRVAARTRVAGEPLTILVHG